MVPFCTTNERSFKLDSVKKILFSARNSTSFQMKFIKLLRSVKYYHAVPAFKTPQPNLDDSRFVGMTGAEIFHKCMQEHDVDTIFGYPGGAILPVFDAIHESPHFRFILPRHEQGAGHMAEGYARATGKPGIVLVTSGPGATNTVTPLMDALMDGTPMIVFTGQVAMSTIGTDAFQEADVVGITRSCTKWNVLVKDIRDLPRRINEAFFIATSGRPGPVLVDLPKDVTAGILRNLPESTPKLAERVSQKEKMFRHAPEPTEDDFQRIADMINNAERPILYAGQGVIQSPGGRGSELLRTIAETANIPCTTTLQGMGAFDELSPLSLHMLGMHGAAYANKAMQNADVIIALGARFDDRVTGKIDRFAPAAKRAEAQGRGGIIHFEVSPKNMNKVIRATEPVYGDVSVNMERLLPFLKHRQRKAWFNEIADWKKQHPFAYEPAGSGLIRPQHVIEELYEQTKHRSEDLVVTTGVGQHQMWAAQYIRWRHPRSFITSGGAGTMGYGVPSAIGAKVALGDKKIVVDIDGDASFVMTGMEMLTAAQYNIGVKILILNNHFQGMVKQWQDLFYQERYSGTPMVNPDFAQLAKSMGVHGIRLDKPEDLKSKMAEFLACKGPVIMDAQVTKESHVFPMVPAGKPLDEMVYAPPKKD